MTKQVQFRKFAGIVLLALALSVVAWGNFATDASAHAHLKTATVAPNATINKAPSSITLTFGEESDLKQTKIQVLDSSGTDDSNGPATVAAGDATTWTVNVKPSLADGTYTVKYHTVTDDDGGIVDGSYTFTLTSTGTAVAGATGGNDAGEKETGGDDAPSAPATGEGGAALVGATNTGSSGLGLLSLPIALLVGATGLLLMLRKKNALNPSR